MHEMLLGTRFPCHPRQSTPCHVSHTKGLPAPFPWILSGSEALSLSTPWLKACCTDTLGGVLVSEGPLLFSGAVGAHSCGCWLAQMEPIPPVSPRVLLSQDGKGVREGLGRVLPSSPALLLR